MFPDSVEFSASDTQAEPILTVNAPIGLGFRDNAGDIVNRANFLDDGGTLDDPSLMSGVPSPDIRLGSSPSRSTVINTLISNPERI